jgi:hypothetical protein
MVNRLCDTQGTAAGKGRRGQRTTGCPNRRDGQTNRYPAHHHAHSITPSTPTVVNQTQCSYRGCNRAAQSRGGTKSARYVGGSPARGARAVLWGCRGKRSRRA